MEESTVTTQDAAAALAVDPKTIRQWCRLGLLSGAYKRLGSNKLGWRIPRTTIAALLEEERRVVLQDQVSA
jgi:predicted site-specific integrase-resolvase